MLPMARGMPHNNRVTYDMWAHYKSLEVLLPRHERKESAIAQIMGAGIRDNAEEKNSQPENDLISISRELRDSHASL